MKSVLGSEDSIALHVPARILSWYSPAHSGTSQLTQWKESTCNVGGEDARSISGSGMFPGGGYSYPLQYSGPEDPMDRVRLVGYSPQAHK